MTGKDLKDKTSRDEKDMTGQYQKDMMTSRDQMDKVPKPKNRPYNIG